MQFIQVRGSGDVFYYTDVLARRDDVDVIEAPEGSTPDTVLEALATARSKLSREADLAAAEAEATAGVRVAARTRKSTRVDLPPGVVVTSEAAKSDEGSTDGTGE